MSRRWAHSKTGAVLEEQTLVCTSDVGGTLQ